MDASNYRIEPDCEWSSGRKREKLVNAQKNAIVYIPRADPQLLNQIPLLFIRARIYIHTNVYIRILTSTVSDLMISDVVHFADDLSNSFSRHFSREVYRGSMTRGASNPHDYRTITYIRTPPRTRERV